MVFLVVKVVVVVVAVISGGGCFGCGYNGDHNFDGDCDWQAS